MPLLTYSLITILDRLVWIINILIFIRVILSWVRPSNNSFVEIIYGITDPLLKPFRDFLDKYISLPIDFSPLLLILFIELVEKILIKLIIILTW